jgi:hypothetical protein
MLAALLIEELDWSLWLRYAGLIVASNDVDVFVGHLAVHGARFIFAGEGVLVVPGLTSSVERVDEMKVI